MILVTGWTLRLNANFLKDLPIAKEAMLVSKSNATTCMCCIESCLTSFYRMKLQRFPMH